MYHGMFPIMLNAWGLKIKSKILSVPIWPLKAF